MNLFQKAVSTAVIMGISLFILIAAATINYNMAITDAQFSCGSDQCIVDAYAAHGFKIDIFETPTQLERIKALFN